MSITKICPVQGCERKTQNNGLCNLHYQRMRAYGNPLHPGVRDRRPWAEKFLERVDVRGDDECWEWKGESRHKFGYGSCTDPRNQHRSVNTHRASWLHFRGPLKRTDWVLHKCDNPPCCNPNHLFIGSCTDNIKDMVSKHRNTKGADHPKSKMTKEFVEQIRRRYTRRGTGNCTIPVLAKEYGISNSTVSMILRNKHWTDDL